MFSLLHRVHLAVLTPLPPSHDMINCSSCITLRCYRTEKMTNKVHWTENVARCQMTTKSYVYKKKTQSIFKDPKNSEVLDYFGTGSGSWILEIHNWRFYPASRYQIVNVARGEMTTTSYVNKENKNQLKPQKYLKLLNTLVLEMRAYKWKSWI